MGIGRVGVWTMAFDTVTWKETQQALESLEQQGWGTVWLPEAFGREALSLSALSLSATSTITIATGIANIWGRDAQSMASAQRSLSEAFPDRFMLGIGISHPLVATARGGDYGGNTGPLESMRAYLDAMDAAHYVGVSPPSMSAPILAALGPKMIALAGERGAGAHTYNSPVAHTAAARSILGEGPLLVPEVKVVLGKNAAAARTLAREFLPLALPVYAKNLHRCGFSEDDVAAVADNVVDALVAHGDVTAVAARVQEHLDAGADHVCLNVLSPPGTLPTGQWQDLAEVFASI
ncbi:TIGR03620 family F420-dependent LLM class oxidoreductase [Mycobacterium sp. URHB0044]|jgi:probable F420-dependent oxidoreductase|uniref:TIGR03620 family F420-dependent LLM class oxidoreductase n=1 Tax=Mycobacterium sp. URHB0044 TaxID=1380386 RepID=UPI000566A11B|nr:TIGR03620 family F420-dependent LLM class oxidoreductase [Mycobacterium sp. URHB0044]